MKEKIKNLAYYLLFGLWWLFSSLPLWIHYCGSIILFFLLRYVFRYRRKLVRRNLRESLPNLSERKLRIIEARFYLYCADLVAESVKFFSISKREIQRRMQFRNLEQLNDSIEHGRSIAIFLGHNCNWEWVSTLPLWLDPEKSKSLQLYHPLENPIMDRLVGYERERMGSTNVPMAQSIRHIMKYQKEGKPVIVGFIADQVPIWESLNYWLPFLGHDTPVMTGGERIARKLDMDCYYLHLRRQRRGKYIATLELMTDTPRKVPEFWITEQYYLRLEANIKQQPSYWLWTHNRWKRSRKDLIRHLADEHRWNELENLKFYDHEHPEGQPAGVTRQDFEQKS